LANILQNGKETMMSEPHEERIRARAFELYVKRGRQEGQALSDWLDAELEEAFEAVSDAQHSKPLSRITAASHGR
jgi:hypothetical protein